MTLEEFFSEKQPVALGFSGGVDSAYLLYAALQLGADVRPYYIKTAFQPQFELNDALRLGTQFGVTVTVLEYNILVCEAVATNPADRCYHCKAAMFGLLQKQAMQDGCTMLIDGSNASDDADDRPGMRALRELDVRSPLRECGLTKAQIRTLSKEAGLFTWNKLAYACLATRIPTGQQIIAEQLQAVENAENVLCTLGFSDFRVRVYHNAARLQFDENQLQKALALREEICLRLKQHFDAVFLDMLLVR